MPFLASLIKSYLAFKTKLMYISGEAFLDIHTTAAIALYRYFQFTFITVAEGVTNMEIEKARMNSVLLDWNEGYI